MPAHRLRRGSAWANDKTVCPPYRATWLRRGVVSIISVTSMRLYKLVLTALFGCLIFPTYSYSLGGGGGKYCPRGEDYLDNPSLPKCYSHEDLIRIASIRNIILARDSCLQRESCINSNSAAQKIKKAEEAGKEYNAFRRYRKKSIRLLMTSGNQDEFVGLVAVFLATQHFPEFVGFL